MAKRVSVELRMLVAARADYLCEYCLIAEEDTFFGCVVDHLLSVKHGGASEDNNLAYACALCNRYKGSDNASLSPQSGALIRFFNPRKNIWAEHFRLDGVYITPLTEIGEGTARILRFNDDERILEREALRTIGRYPVARAIARSK